MSLRRSFRLALILLVLSMGAATAFLFTAPGEGLQSELQNRSPQELVRYLKRRLAGHPKLEFVFLPPLHWVQRHYEREPMLLTLPSLGKGQQAKGDLEDPSGTRQEWRVSTPQEIRQALLGAMPGTHIVVEPGLYMFEANLYLGRDGEVGFPISLRAARPGTVWLEFKQMDGILVNRPHWQFENLNIRGVCAQEHNCEHAFHVVGRATHTTIHNNLLVDFNAQIKVNGNAGEWPDHGIISQNTLFNRSERNTDRPVTPLDIVGASHWKVVDNLVANFVKLGGNQVSYGMFMKGASEGGRFERNLVICSMTQISRPGIRVGLSFGAGESGTEYCRDKSCAGYEHRDGLAANNIIAHCNDTGIDVNRSLNIALHHNTLINTSGIALRGKSQARVQGNLYEGVLAARGSSQLTARWNKRIDARDLFRDPDALNLDWRRVLDSIPTDPLSKNDFTGTKRIAGTVPGALN